MTHPLRPALLAVLLAAGALTGCDRSTEAQTAVRSAGHRFGAITPAISDHGAAGYREIAESVERHAGDDDGYAQAAAVTLAQARLGQAAQAAQDAARAESEALRRIRVLRGSLGEFHTLSAVAEAASRFDATNDLSEIDALVKARRNDAAAYEAQKAEINAEVTGLEARVAELRANAAAERAKAGELGLQMAGVNAQRSAELAAEAREHTLRADQFDLEADRIEGRIGQLRPSAAEIALNVEKANAQIQQLLNAQRELQARGRAAQTDAAETRAAVAQARDRIAALARELAEFRDGEVTQRFDRITGLLSQAQSALREAGSLVPASASVTGATIAEVSGSAWNSRAAGHLEAATIFESLAAAGIPGPWASHAERERGAAAEATANAAEAYQNAARALRAVRAAGSSSDKLAAAAARLERLAGVQPEADPSDAEFLDEEETPYDADAMDEGETDPDAESDED